MDWIGWVIGAIGALLAVPVLVLTWRAERRATERSIVEWYGEETAPGRVVVTHQGADPAYEVRVEAWDRHSVVTIENDVVRVGDELTLELPHRLANGPDPIALPERFAPRVSDEPPKGIDLGGIQLPPAVLQMNASARSEWERMKRMQDALDAQDAAARRRAEARQVNVRVSWRSKRGTWSVESVPLSAMA